MKIVHICNYFQPQLGYQEYFLAKEHLNLGHDVTVITSERYFPFPDYKNTVQNILGKRIVKAGVFNCGGIKLIRLNILFEFAKRVFLKNLKAEILKIKPDIVICHGITNFNALRLVKYKNKLKFKLIFDEHMLFSENKSRIKKLFYKFFNFKKILKNGEKFIGISPGCKEFIIKNYKFPENKVEMIPLGADTDLFKYNKNLRTEFRSSYNIPDKNIVIVYTGKLTFKKSPHSIILAMELIKDKINEKITLLFTGNFEKKYKKFFQKTSLILSDSDIEIITAPAVDNSELVKIYSASDIACWTSEASISTIEASSCSLPIICPEFLPERYKNNNGIPVKKNNINEIADALFKLITNKALRSKMGLKGRELVEKELSWKIIAKRFIE